MILFRCCCHTETYLLDYATQDSVSLSFEAGEAVSLHGITGEYMVMLEGVQHEKKKPRQPHSSSSSTFAASRISPSAEVGSQRTLTFNRTPINAKQIHPRCPSNHPPLTPTAYRLVIPTGASALSPLVTVSATAFSVASVLGLGATSFKQSCTQAKDIAMPEPKKTQIAPSVQNAARKSARRSSFAMG
jgi:hypothetical protein